MEGGFGVLLHEVVESPLRGEEDDEVAVEIVRELDADAEVSVAVLVHLDAEVEPADDGEGGRLNLRVCAVLGLKTVHDDVELELSDGAEKRGVEAGVGRDEGLNDALVEKLVEPCGFPWKLRDILPKVLPAGAPAGRLSEVGAKRLDVSGHLKPGVPLFYGELVPEEAFVERMRSASIMNLVGERTIALAIEHGYVDESNVLVIGETKHAQVVKG